MARKRSESLPEKPDRCFTVDGFFRDAKRLRRYFDDVFEDPRGADPRRFCWDYWQVPGQYRLLRTPAYHFFPKPLYERLHRELVLWGRRNLGCHDISPPWMSCYVDGCEQLFHADLPHGPWSFVFSLTPWAERAFQGGETVLLREEVLDFWKAADLGGGMEEREVIESIAPEMNRLVVFDPRIPHGVRRVSGPNDVRQGRLVIHGWFVNPRPFIEGPLKGSELSEKIEELVSNLDRWISKETLLQGMMSVRFRIDRRGQVGGLTLVTQTLRVKQGEASAPRELMTAIMRELSLWRFSLRAAGSQVTLPLVFTADQPEL
ncbi:MAG: hypothetical protein RJB38_882 [Pseudomonadota bacterium]